MYAPCTNGTAVVSTLTSPTSINVTIPNHLFIYKITTGIVTNVAVTGVSINPTSASISIGSTALLTKAITPTNASNQNVIWSSNNTAVATVNNSGLVTGVSAGSATITVTTVDGSKTATSAITVTAPVGGTWTIVDNAASGWTWNGFNTDPCSTCYNGSSHATNIKNKTAEYTFTGTNVEAYCESWSGAGTVKILIDGVLKGTYSQIITPYTGNTKFATITGLSNSSHVIKFLTTSTNWVGIDYIRFAVNPPAGTLAAKNSSVLNVNKQDNKTFSIYPNPATNFVIIDFHNDLNNSVANVEIIDLSGKLIYKSGNVSHTSVLQLNVSKYLKGIYLIKIVKDNSVTTKKIILE